MNKPKRPQALWIANLRTLMTARGFNPRKLSLKAGLNSTAVRDMLEGRIKFPRYDTVEALASALAITPAQLMGGIVSTNAPDLRAKKDDDLELLTEIIARLQEVAAAYKHPLPPDDFAAMVTTIYRQMQGNATRKTAKTSLRPKLQNLFEYEALRRRARR